MIAKIKNFFLHYPEINVPFMLYVIGLTLLLLHIGSNPSFPYNWEAYTIWDFLKFWDHPSLSIFRLTDGLMTDGGKSPIIVFPVWFAFKISGIGLTQLRISTALLASATIPIFWLIARRVSGATTATLATILLIISPVFLLYGRTATTVGLSLLPALLTVYVLILFIQQPEKWKWLVILQVLLLINTYCYGPIRFFWPLSIILLAGEVLWRSRKRLLFFTALIPTIFILPFFLIFFYNTPGSSPFTIIANYYNGRGEQIFTINAQNAYHYFLKPLSANQIAESQNNNKSSLLLSLILQNAQNYSKKNLNFNTSNPVVYWNSSTRLYSGALTPFFVIGLIYFFIKVKKIEYRILLILYWGLGLPILLTSYVDVGRLIFTLPLILIIAANGFMLIYNFCYRYLIKISFLIFPQLIIYRLTLLIFWSILIVPITISSWQDYGNMPQLFIEQNYCNIPNITPNEITYRDYFFKCK